MSSHFFLTFGKKLLVSFIITIMVIPAQSNPILAVDKVSNQKQYGALNDYVIINTDQYIFIDILKKIYSRAIE